MKNSENKAAVIEKNIAAVHGITKAIETGDVSKLGDYIAADAVDHGGPMGEIKGIDNIKAWLGSMHAGAADMKIEILKMVADDEYVFEWTRPSHVLQATDWGSWAGKNNNPQPSTVLQATDWGMWRKNSLGVTLLHVSRFKDGKATEHWTFIQPAEMMKMMSSQTTTENKMDTAMN